MNAAGLLPTVAPHTLSSRIVVARALWNRSRRAFTLIELLVVISIIGILCSLLLPAVQHVREAGRRTQCTNNMRNQILAVHNFHDAHRRFPVGRNWERGMETSWILQLLPQLEQSALAEKFDHQRPWTDPNGNLAIADAELAILRCPSGIMQENGDTDYGGMMGSSITALSWETAFDNGVMIEVRFAADHPLNFASISDGTSQTICLAESVDRQVTRGGRWISGYNCFQQDAVELGPVNGGEIYSQHRTGANAAFADGSIHYLSAYTDPFVVGAVCTRNLGEIVNVP